MDIAVAVVVGVVAGVALGIGVHALWNRRERQNRRYDWIRILSTWEEVTRAQIVTQRRLLELTATVARRLNGREISGRELSWEVERLVRDLAELDARDTAAVARLHKVAVRMAAEDALEEAGLLEERISMQRMERQRYEQVLRRLMLEIGPMESLSLELRTPKLARPDAVPALPPALTSPEEPESIFSDEVSLTIGHEPPSERRDPAIGRRPEPRPSPPHDPPRISYGYIDAPASVVSDVEFEVEIGLSATLADNVASDPIERPASSVGPYFIEIHVTAHDFRLRSGERWHRTLAVTSEEPYPTFELHLAAAPQSEDVVNRSIKATYTIAGQTVGIAARPIRVRRDLEIVPPGDAPRTVTDFSVPIGETPPDLTIIIEKISSHRIGWRYHSPHRKIDRRETLIEVDLGDARQFARDLVADIQQEQTQSTLFSHLKGKGRRISWKMPPQVLEAIRDAGKLAAPNPPTIFILSEEPYVPWELAVLDPPLLDASAPPFLAAQATVGRWVLLPRQHARTTAPRLRVDVGAIVVVAGKYSMPGYARLVGAEDESAQLQMAPYAATAVNATVDDVMLCISGTPKADVMHFAMHGTYDTAMPQDGLITIDGKILRPDTIAGSDLSNHPFVFLNACQVGSSSEVLGDYAGMAAAFIAAGAAGVIAPLWTIKDGVARDMAMAFYRKALVEGERPAVILRDERRKFAPPDPAAASTYLAYLFFGHPELTLAQSERSH